MSSRAPSLALALTRGQDRATPKPNHRAGASCSTETAAGFSC